MKYRNFRTAYCEHFGCSEGDYQMRMFWACLYPHARPLARVILKIDPQYFDRDLELIRTLGAVTDLQTMEAEVNDFATQNCEDGLLRRRCHIRTSGQRMLNVGETVFLRPSCTPAPTATATAAHAGAAVPAAVTPLVATRRIA